MVRPSTVFATCVDGVAPLGVENSQPCTDAKALSLSPAKLSGLRPWNVVCDVVSIVICVAVQFELNPFELDQGAKKFGKVVKVKLVPFELIPVISPVI